MKLIKFIFWLFLTFTIAYLMTDLKIADKTIKQRIDQMIAGTVVGDAKDKAIRWITDRLEPKSGEKESEENPPSEDISDKDANELKKLIQKNN